MDDALKIAEGLDAGGMARSQLRNFYNEVADIKHLLMSQPGSFDQLRARVLKLGAFAHNATSQRTNRAPQLFSDFITQNIRFAADDEKSFLRGFYDHFECVVLYFKGRQPS